MAQRFDPNTYPLTGGLRLLEASAGTGKTFALAHLCLRLITESALPVDALLVVTYTEAAAAELRSRIGNRLQLALRGLECLMREDPLPTADAVLMDWWVSAPGSAPLQSWISRLLIALEQLDLADITTIHGFCRRSLRRMALISGAAMQPQLETDSHDLVQEVVQDLWHQQLLNLPFGHLQGLRLAGLSPDALRQGLLRVDADPWPRLEIDGADFDPDQPLAPQLQAFQAKSWACFSKLWRRDGVALEHSFRSAAQQWKASGCSDTKPYSAKPRTDRCGQLTLWLEQQSEAQPPDLTSIRKQEKLLRDYFHPGPWCKAARKAGETEPSLAMPELQEAIAALWDGPVERVWRYALRRGLAQLAERRQRRGVITFAGLLAAMDPGDGDPRWLEPLRQRYRAVLVDEFQDTDSLQWRLLHRAFGAADRHLLLLVGDPKQAIYRFRGGDLDTYKQARQQVQRIDNLLDNHRTTAPLMEGLNRLMDPGLPLSELSAPEVQACSSEPAPTLPDDQWPLQVVSMPEQPTASTKTALEEALPPRVADVIVGLLADQPQRMPADLCLLVSRHDQATVLRRALADRGVPTRLVNQGDVLETEAAQVLQWLLDALAMPGDDRRLRLLACSPLLGWSSEQLRSGAQDGGLDQLAQRLRLQADRIQQLGLLGCLSDLLEGRLMADLSERGRLLGDLQQAARLVQEAMHTQGLDLSSAADWLRRQRLNPPSPVPDARQPHSDLADSAVAVVTVHRSKGLEYPVVICPYLWQGPREVKGPLWRQRGEAGWSIALDRNWGEGFALSQLEQRASAAEAERLAYVAVTRARSQLLLVWARSKGQEPSPLQGWLFGEGDPADQMRQLPLTAMPFPAEPTQQRWSAPRHREALGLGATPQRIDRSWGRSSYSAWIAAPLDPARLDQGRDRDPQGEEASLTDVDSDAALWSEQGPLAAFPRGAAAGDCLHRILEQIPFQASEQAAAVIDSELRRAGLDESWTPAVLEGMKLVLTTPLGGRLGSLELGDLTAERRLHELSFDLPVEHVRTGDLLQAFQRNPEASFGGEYLKLLSRLSINSRGFLTGSIDLVFSDHPDPQQARWWVADWKSNWLGERGADGLADLCGPRHYDPGAMQAQMLHHHYPLQAHLYLVALHRHLRWRLPGYSPERHLGGYVYVFLRGMPGRDGWSDGGVGPGRLVEPAPLERVLALDRALEGVAG